MHFRNHPFFIESILSQAYKVNQKRNFYSVLSHGVYNGELLPPLAVIGVPRDPIADLEDRLAREVPNLMELLGEKSNSDEQGKLKYH